MKLILFPLGVLFAVLAVGNGMAALMLAAVPTLACILFLVLAAGFFSKAYELDRGNGKNGMKGMNDPQSPAVEAGTTPHIPGNRCRED